MKRMRSIVGAVAAATLVLAGCSTGSNEAKDTSKADTKAAKDAFPVTVEHAYGSTEITKEPVRVATLGWSDQDVVLALGVVPVGSVAITWGGNDAQSTPWFDAKLEELDGEQPTRYSDADGIPTDEVGKLAPDLILATNSGLTKEEYDKLSKLAPVVAYPGDAWATTWAESLDMIGKALGRTAEAEKLADATAASIADAADANPQVVGKSFIFTSLTPADTSKIDYYTPNDNRPRILAELGMKNAPIIERLAKGSSDFYQTISAERASELESDVLVTYAESDADLPKIEKDPLLSQIPALKTGAVVASTDKTDALGLSSPSPLSIPWAMEKFVPLVAAAVDKADASS